MKRGSKLATALIVLAFIFVVTLSVMSAAAGEAEAEQPTPEPCTIYIPMVETCDRKSLLSCFADGGEFPWGEGD